MVKDRFDNILKRNNIVAFSSKGASKENLGKKFKITDIIGEDLELLDSKNKKLSTSARNVVKIR